MKVVCISDTHGKHYEIESIPDGDLLVHAGDFSLRGDLVEAELFAEWFGNQPHKHKVAIAGNHDLSVIHYGSRLIREIFEDNGVHYLQDTSVEIMGHLVHGSPWQPYFHNWAFNLKTEEELYDRFEQAQIGTDILITHGPPLGVLDNNKHGESCGSSALLKRIREIEPKLFVCGHIHESRGVSKIGTTKCVNASCVDLRLNILRSPAIVVEI